MKEKSPALGNLETYLERIDISEKLDNMAPEFGEINKQKFIVGAMMALRNNPALERCTKLSVYEALLNAYSACCYVNDGTGYLVPYGASCSFMIGYQGMIRLAYLAGMTQVKATCFYANEKLDIVDGTSVSIAHKVLPNKDDRGDFAGAYAFVKTSSNDVFAEVMTKEEINAVKATAKRQEIWTKHFGEMAKKTVVRRLFKYLPKSKMSDAIQQAISRDDEQSFVSARIEKIELPEAATKTEAINQLLIKKEEA